jgi:hypothetical protein
MTLRSPGPATTSPVQTAHAQPAHAQTALVQTALVQTAFVQTVADVALDDALVRIRELSGRLWEVRRVHAPVPVRSLRGPRVRCAACGQACPCPTRQAVDAA